jgi:hypothetical protein
LDARTAGALDTRSETLEVTLTATRTVWVAANADHERVIYRLLAPEERVAVAAANHVHLRIGDAGALLVSVNGSSPVPAGSAGEVRNVSIARDNAGTTPVR